MRVFLTIVKSLILLILIGAVLYLMRRNNRTIEPIVKYECSCSVVEFEDAIKTLAHDNHYPLLKTSHIEEPVDNGKRDISFNVNAGKSVLEYDLACKANYSNKAIIKVIKAYNLTSKAGGYSIEADSIKPLLTYFDNNVVGQLKKKGIILQPYTSYWDQFWGD